MERYSAPNDMSANPQVSNGAVRIGKYWYKVVNGQVSPLNLARWPSKITTGDYNLDSDPLMSSLIVSSLTGGIGNWEIKPGVDDQTYWTGTLETRFPEGPTLLPLTEQFELDPDNPADAAYPLGDFYYGGDNPYFLAAFDTALCSWDESTQAWVDSGNSLTATPDAHGVNWDGSYYVPLGGDGYDVIDPSLAVTNSMDIEPIHMLVWDKKLCAIDVDGNFYWMAVGGSWSTADPERQVPTGQRARRLVNFINSQNIPTIYIVTNSTMYAFDPDGGTGGVLYETRLDYPKHPNQGRAAANWRGDGIYVSVGLGIHSYDGNIVASMGPDGRYGLPSHLRGTIVDLAAEYNNLIALVQGVPSDTYEQPDEVYITHPPMYRDRDTYAISNFPFAPVYSSIYRYANSQWHPAWESDDAEGVPTWMAISEAGGAYRLWWGYAGRMYTQELPVAFQNPKQSLLSGGKRFAPKGSLITGWFDADMKPFDKLLSHVEVNLDYVSKDVSDLSAGGTVSIFFQLDDDAEESWRPLGTANTVGMTIMPFRNQARQVGNYFSRGRAFNRVRFRIDYEQEKIEDTDPGSPTFGQMVYNQYTSPLMYSMVVKFQKIPETQLSWSFSVDLMDPEGYRGVGNKDLFDYLNYLLSSDEFFEFGHNDRIYRVRSAQVGASGFTGYNSQATVSVNLLQVNTGTLRRDSTVYSYVDIDNG